MKMSSLNKLKFRAKRWETYAKEWGRGGRKCHVSPETALSFAEKLWREYYRLLSLSSPHPTRKAP